MKKIIILFSVLAIYFFYFSASAYANPVDILCLMDSSYRSEYTSPSNNLSTTMTNAEYPFKNRWNITFNKTFMNVNNIPIDYCSLSYSSNCTSSTCGSSCVNSTSTSNHHKNIYRNFYKVKNDISISGYDLMLTVSSSNLCYQKNGAHSTGILGLGDVSGSHVFVKNNTTRGMKLNVRVIQHELSHNYGCLDNACSSGQNCIMNGGFDNNSTYNLYSIWCADCLARFDPYAH